MLSPKHILVNFLWKSLAQRQFPEDPELCDSSFVHSMDLAEAEATKKWQEYTVELYKKDLHDPDNHSGVITHLELDILECEV